MENVKCERCGADLNTFAFDGGRRGECPCASTTRQERVGGAAYVPRGRSHSCTASDGCPCEAAEVSSYLSRIGKRGGAAGRGAAKARTTEQARKAAHARWAKR